MSSTLASVEFVSSGNERLEAAGKVICYGHYSN